MTIVSKLVLTAAYLRKITKKAFLFQNNFVILHIIYK